MPFEPADPSRGDQPRLGSAAPATAESAGAESAGAESAPGGGQQWQLWSGRLLAPLLYVLTSAAIAWPVLAHLGQRMPGSSDGILFSWYFEWIAQAAVHGHNPFVSEYMNAPTGVNIMWNTSVFLLAVACIPLTLSLGAAPTVALLMVFGPAASAAACYWVLRRLSGRSVGAAIGAAVYAYGPFNIGQFGHLHLLIAVFPPVLVLLGHRLLIAQTGTPRRLGIVLGVVTGVQLLVSEEIVALSALAAAVALCWLLVLNRDRIAGHARFALTAAAIAVPTAVVIAAVPLYFQFFGANALSAFEVSPNRADLASFVRPSLLQYYASRADVHAGLRFPANGAENTGYLGWPLVIAALVVCGWALLRRERFAAWWLLTALSLAVLMLGTPIDYNGKAVMRGPWTVIRRLPLFSSAIPVRISLLLLLMVAGLIAWTLARLRGRALVVGVLVTAAVLVPLRPVLPLPAARMPATPRFFTTAAVQAIPRGAITVVLPQAQFPRNQAMAWQVRAHMRFALVGGYSVFKKGNGGTFFPPLPAFVAVLRSVGVTGYLDQALVDPARASIPASGARYIVITDQQRHQQAVADAAATITGCTPRQAADVLLCAIP